MISNIAELNAVYPRWRGELYKLVGEDIDMTGLSPLARGTQLARLARVFLCRFIPAGAGNSLLICKYFLSAAVYPRWRGELTNAAHQGVSSSGLSPLARGTPPGVPQFRGTTRFIPAGAGNSKFERIPVRVRAVYPRWRGELTKHNLLLIIDFLSQSQSTNLTETHKQHIHYVKEHLIH